MTNLIGGHDLLGDRAYDAAVGAAINVVKREVALGDAETIRQKLTKLQNRAVKLGQPRFGVWGGDEVTRTAYHCVEWFGSERTILSYPPPADGIWRLERVERFVEFTIEQVTVGLAGWSFVATLTYLSTDDGRREVLISAVPGEDVPEEFRSSTPDRCDHCGVARYRTESFVVANQETGEYKQVGRQCLAAFLGTDPTKVMAACRLFGSMDEDGFWGAGGRGEDAWPLDLFLGCCVHEIEASGWVSRGKARDAYGVTATADAARHLMVGDRQTEPYVPTEAEYRTAREALDWHAANWADLPDPNDYQHNLAVALRLGCAVEKTLGIVASLISVWGRETEKANRERLEAERRESAPSAHVGREGQRLDIEADRLLGTRMIESQWGCSVLLTFTDTTGNVFKWFCSGDETPLVDALNEKARGERARVVVTATVKKHDEWKGERQTVLTRLTTWTPQAIEAAEKKAARLAARRSA